MIGLFVAALQPPNVDNLALAQERRVGIRQQPRHRAALGGEPLVKVVLDALDLGYAENRVRLG